MKIIPLASILHSPLEGESKRTHIMRSGSVGGDQEAESRNQKPEQKEAIFWLLVSKTRHPPRYPLNAMHSRIAAPPQGGSVRKKG